MLAPTTIDGHRGIVLDAYLELSRGLTSGEAGVTAKREHWQSYYDAFCEGRSQWMIGQMGEWLGRPLDADARRWIEA